MKRLLLMRHAKSSWKQPVADATRHLNERGARDARAVALELELMDFEPDLVLASNAARCRETWGEMTRRSRWMNEKRVKDVKYLSEFYGIFDRPASLDVPALSLVSSSPSVLFRHPDPTDISRSQKTRERKKKKKKRKRWLGPRTVHALL